MLPIHSSLFFTTSTFWRAPIFLGLAFSVSSYTTPFFAKHFRKNPPLIRLGQLLNLGSIYSFSKLGCRVLGIPLSFFQIFKIFLFSSTLFLSYRLVTETYASKKWKSLNLFESD